MASVDAVYCSPCEFRHVSKQAASWCTNCQEAFCHECCDNHTASRASRDHHVIPIVDKGALPLGITIHNSCTIHSKKFEYFCKEHDDIICFLCISTKHSQCNQNIVPLEEVARGSKSSTALADLEQRLTDAIKNAKRLTDDRVMHFENIDDQKDAIQNEIKKIRSNLNSELDKMETKLLQDLDTEYNKCKSKLQMNLDQSNDVREQLKHLNDNVKTIKQFTSDIQTFQETRNINKTLVDLERRIDDIASTVHNYRFEIKVNSFIENLISGDVTTLGEIVNSPLPNSLALSQRASRQAQLHVIHSSFDAVQTIEICHWQVYGKVWEGPVYRRLGCVLLPGERFAIIDWIHKHLVLMKESPAQGEGISECVVLSGCPYGMALFDSSRVLISYSPGNHIEILNTQSKRVENRIQLQTDCYGIAYDDNKIFVVTNNGEIQVMDVQGCLMRTIKTGMSDFYNIHVNAGKIFLAPKNEDTLYCIDMTGSLVWKFQDDDLKAPRGIGTDDTGNVYVSGFYSDNIFMISADGRSSKEILNIAHGIKRPRAVFFDKLNSLLLVTSGRLSSNDAFLFTVIRS